MARAFASQADMAEKKITFSRLSEHAYAFTAEGDPNTGIVVGDDAVMVIDAQATPKMAQTVIEHIRTVTDKPIKYVVLSHYHAVRVLGASGYGAEHIICSEATRDLIVERGQQDYKSRAAALPAPVPGGRDDPGPDLADHDLRRPHVAVAGQAAGRHHPCRPRPHQGRHDRLAARGAHAVQRRPGRVRRHALLRRRALQGLARDAAEAARPQGRGAGAGPRRRADGRAGGARRASPARSSSWPSSTRPCRPRRRPAIR